MHTPRWCNCSPWHATVNCHLFTFQVLRQSDGLQQSVPCLLVIALPQSVPSLLATNAVLPPCFASDSGPFSEVAGKSLQVTTPCSRMDHSWPPPCSVHPSPLFTAIMSCGASAIPDRLGELCWCIHSPVAFVSSTALLFCAQHHDFGRRLVAPTLAPPS